MTLSLVSRLARQGVVLLDGGLATELERRGYDLNHRLWSARLMLDEPHAIGDVHRAYLAAGADCLISCSYQASIPGLMREGLSEKESQHLLKRTVGIACEVRDEFVEQNWGEQQGELDAVSKPLVAASVGPYGAYLADGSEYVGKYEISSAELRSFHQPRWTLLNEAGADLLACETIPSLQEAKVLKRLLEETPGCQAWVSFSCRDEKHVSDGTPLSHCVSMFDDLEQVVAVGLNCTAPRFVNSLIDCARAGAPRKQIVVYPNAGQIYDADLHQWIGEAAEDWGGMAQQWRQRGAALIGGCCGTGPPQIKAIYDSLTSG